MKTDLIQSICSAGAVVLLFPERGTTSPTSRGGFRRRANNRDAGGAFGAVSSLLGVKVGEARNRQTRDAFQTRLRSTNPVDEK